MNKSNTELYLGASLLKTALGDKDDSMIEERYQDLLKAPGIDGALYLLFHAVNEDPRSDAKTLAQAAYMLGYYVANSVKEIDILWESGPNDEPKLDWKGE
jgi:hypothetical protein